MTNLTIRVDEYLKEEAKKQAKELGVSLSFVIKNALSNFIKKPQITLGEGDDVITEQNKKHYKEAMQDLKNGVNIVSQEEIFAKYL